MFIYFDAPAIPMESEQALYHYESFYESIHPATEKNEAFLWLSEIPHFLFNAVMHVACKGDVAAKVDALIAKNKEGRPLSFWIHEQNQAEGLTAVLQTRGFKSAISCALMTCQVENTESVEVDIRVAGRKSFDAITATAFQFDAAIQEKYAALLDRAEGEFYLIYEDGEPACTGLLLPRGEYGGIFNIGTLPEYERRGCGSKMIKFLQHRAYALGLKKIILLCPQHLEMFYSRLGFKNVLSIDIYASPREATLTIKDYLNRL